ncbi:hypothetical protein H4R24_001110 [Coemansia sp. RSA 988]|nr:hypothetical protein H4R24_001110 [Coemansia sp. RSA 988]
MATANTPSYTLRYFNFPGRAETTRLLLTAANVEWTEENPEWPQEKSNQPFGRLPVLIEKSTDGSPDFIITESSNMERYLRTTYGILLTDPKNSALQDQLRGQHEDVTISFVVCVNAISEEDKKARLESFHEIYDKFIAEETKILKENGNTGYLFGDSLSYADITSYAFYKTLVIGYQPFMEDIADITKSKLTPEIIKLISTVEAAPILAKYLSKVESLSAAINA